MMNKNSFKTTIQTHFLLYTVTWQYRAGNGAGAILIITIAVKTDIMNVKTKKT